MAESEREVRREKAKRNVHLQLNGFGQGTDLQAVREMKASALPQNTRNIDPKLGLSFRTIEMRKNNEATVVSTIARGMIITEIRDNARLKKFIRFIFFIPKASVMTVPSDVECGTPRLHVDEHLSRCGSRQK